MQDTPLRERSARATPVSRPWARAASRFLTHTFKNGVTVRTWTSVLRDLEVVLRIYSTPDRPAAWAWIEDKIVNSLQRQ